MKHIILGKKGEQIAAKYLKNKGYKIITKNYKTNYGEVDIIVLDKTQLVFVEVKARESLAYGSPSEAVNIKKQKTIKTIATNYLINLGIYPCNCRFDVVEVLAGEVINHIENAF